LQGFLIFKVFMNWINSHLGEFAALLTAVFWTFSAISFESASNKIGSMAVNLIRLLIGLIFISIYTLFSRGLFLPFDASSENWKWLILSGIIGFVFGDLFLFKSYTIIGSRFSMLIMTLVPPLTALFGWIILGEKLSLLNYLGMAVTFAGISLAIFSRENKNEKITLKLAPRGILFAFFGAIGQALGLVLSKFGMLDYDPFAATQIRIIAGIFTYGLLVSVLGRWQKVYSSVFNTKAMYWVTIGALFGPFLGVAFSLVSVKHTQAGIASTIIAIIPILLIPPAIFIFKQKVTWLEIIGAVISVGGVAMFFV
jgi:drug/metabolite transporter (DMT)-like permease